MVSASDQTTEWSPDWEAIAHRVVERTLDVQAGERVVYLVDPYLYPEFFHAVRAAVLRRGGVEQATMLGWSRRITGELRNPRGQARDPDARDSERRAHLELVQTADIFMWLPTDFRFRSHTRLESEWILNRWRGRGIHFHWFPDPGTELTDPINTELQRIYERAILELDYGWLRERQQRLVDRIRGQTLRVATAAGTDLTFALPSDGWYHINDGDASRAKALRAVCARDREEEIPCGAVRALPAPDSVNGIVSLRGPVSYNGDGLPIRDLWDELDLVFKDGHISELRGGSNQATLDAAWDELTGDKDRLGEIVFGTNPLLTTPPGARMPTYWGFGEGMFRLHLGDNIESSGTFSSNLRINLFLRDATVDVNGELLIDEGQLVMT